MNMKMARPSIDMGMVDIGMNTGTFVDSSFENMDETGANGVSDVMILTIVIVVCVIIGIVLGILAGKRSANK